MIDGDDRQEALFPPEKGANVPPSVELEMTGTDAGFDDDDEEERFDWFGEDVVVHQQKGLAVYRNRADGIVIRAELGNLDGDEDICIILATPGAAYRLIEAIQRQLDQMKEERKK